MTANTTVQERIAVLESQFNDIKTELLNTRADIKSVNTNLERFFSTNTEKEMRTAIELNNLQQVVAQLKRRSGVWSWLTPSLAAASGAVLSLLVQNYINHLPH